MIHLLAQLSWDPGVRGVLVVGVAVGVLMGSVYLLLATNSGPRLGFLLALTALFGWMTIMGLTWSIYGIGKKGPDPHWVVKDANFNDLAQSNMKVAQGLPQPDKLPTAASFLAKDPALAKQFPTIAGVKPPGLGDLLGVEPSLEKVIKQQLPKGWTLLATSDPQTGEANAAASAYLTTTSKTFSAATDFVVLDAYSLGGKYKIGSNLNCSPTKIGSYGNCLRRARFKLGRIARWPLGQPPHYAVVQVQGALVQATEPGQPPPLAKADPKADVVSVVMERDLGGKRLPSVGVTLFSALVFAICCNSLHRRDKLVAKARLAAAGKK